jgi:hypothetical protein
MGILVFCVFFLNNKNKNKKIVRYHIHAHIVSTVALVGAL